MPLEGDNKMKAQRREKKRRKEGIPEKCPKCGAPRSWMGCLGHYAWCDDWSDAIAERVK